MMGNSVQKKSILNGLRPHRIADNEVVKEHRINKRADAKLGMVADAMKDMLGPKCTGMTKSLLRRELILEHVSSLTTVRLDYTRYQNRLWSFCYDLRVSADLDVSGSDFPETEPVFFRGKTVGKKSERKTRMLDASPGLDDEKGDAYSNVLNQELILSRIDDLDMRDVQLRYDPDARIWHVEFTTILGSATWVAIPPVIQLIKPREDELAKMIEFCQMTLKAASVQAAKLHRKEKEKAKAEKRSRFH